MTDNQQANDVVLQVNHVSKDFKLPTEHSNEIKQVFINWTKGVKGYKVQHVLRDISFEVNRGDFFGIVGRNGSGKSTLLKLISGIYTPNKGEIKVNGSLVPFIELGVGFNPELTGRENVYLNGAMLGFTEKQIDAMYDDIVEFAELGEFMDQKLKNYSSGMQVRLAFSVAIKAQGDILVLDEVLAVGDEAFQRKCANFFEKVKQDSTKTVILVTHDMSAVRRYCSKAIMIDGGKIVDQGDPDDVADSYSLENISSDPDARRALKEMKKNRNSYVKVDFNSEQVLSSKDILKATIVYKSTTDRPSFVRASLQANGVNIMSVDNCNKPTNDHKKHKLEYMVPMKDFVVGDLRLVVSLVDVETKSNIASIGFNDELPIKITNTNADSLGLIKNSSSLSSIR